MAAVGADGRDDRVRHVLEAEAAAHAAPLLEAHAHGHHGRQGAPWHRAGDAGVRAPAGRSGRPGQHGPASRRLPCPSPHGREPPTRRLGLTQTPFPHSHCRTCAPVVHPTFSSLTLPRPTSSKKPSQRYPSGSCPCEGSAPTALKAQAPPHPSPTGCSQFPRDGGPLGAKTVGFIACPSVGPGISRRPSGPWPCLWPHPWAGSRSQTLHNRHHFHCKLRSLVKGTVLPPTPGYCPRWVGTLRLSERKGPRRGHSQ